jgi:hypothetical protein
MLRLSRCACLLLLTASLLWCPTSFGDESGPEDGDCYAECVILVQQLGDEQFSVRERATTRLIEIGLPARTALNES